MADDFITKFHSLQGVTISERKRDFFKLLQQVAPSLKTNPELLSTISSNLNPTTHLESLFILDFFIYFRQTQQLLELLKNGNDIFISKIARQVWFFQEAFNQIPAEEIVNEILPTMSFSVRMKILNKLSRYSPDFDKIFNAVVARYGIFLASRFITGCSPEKIREILTEYPIKLNSTQLRILYEKDRELIDFYFTQICNDIRDRKYKNLIKFIFTRDRTLFEFLEKKYSISALRIGRRATKKIVAEKRDEIIENPYKFETLNMTAVFRKIGKDTVKLFTNILPAKMESNCIDKDQIFRCLPKKYRYSLFVKIFPAHYKIKFEDYHHLINKTLLNLVVDNSERALLAKIKVDEGCDEFIKYLKTEESIQLIKEKINVTSSIYQRGEFIENLIETCHINKDLVALLSVMKYFCFRHKNDDLQVHLEFIRNIERRFDLKKFSEEMWTVLNEMLAIHMLKFDNSKTTYKKIQTMSLISFNLGTSTYQKLSYLEFLFKKGDSIDELIREYFTTNEEFPAPENYDKNFAKYFLLFAIKNIRKGDDEAAARDFNQKLFREIVEWNKYHKNDVLSFYDFPNLVEMFYWILENSTTATFPKAVSVAFREKIFTTQPNNYRDEYLKIYWKNSHVRNWEDIKWFLKYDPMSVVLNFDAIFTGLIDDPKCLYIWSVFKKYSHLELPENSVKKCLELLNDDSVDIFKPNLIPCLSIMMKFDEFLSFADSYKPENKKLDLTNEKEVKLYKIQCAIASNFQNTKNYKVLSSLLNYCAGDYLKYVLRSLYSLLYHTPESALIQYFNYLSKKAVSVRKHVLYLACELSTSTDVENMIRILSTQEENQSLQKYMFSSTIQYFVKNPSESIFELVKLNMNFITEADEESLKNIVEHLDKIPKKYKARYVEYAWIHFEKTVDTWRKLRKLKAPLLNYVDEEVARELSLEFGLAIIQQHFMSEDKHFYDINNFVLVFMITQNEKSIIFSRIFSILDESENQKDVLQFLRNGCKKIMARKDDIKYFTPYVDYFERKISLIENFDDYVNIFFLRAKVESLHLLPLDDFVSKILVFFDEVIAKCGIHVLLLFAKNLNSSLGYFTTTYVTICDFFHSMIKQRPVPEVAIMILHVISEPSERQYFERKVFRKILGSIKNIDDIGVQIYLCNKCKKYFSLYEIGVSGDSLIL